MLKRHRRRQYRHQNSGSAVSIAWARPIVIGILLVIGLVLFGFWVVEKFQGNTVQKSPIDVLPENGTVSISLEDGQWRKIDNSIRIYAGDKVSTNQNSNATLSLFDGSNIRMDTDTQIQVTESQIGDLEAQWSVYVEKGNIWVYSPSSTSYSGSIVRSVNTTAITMDIPPGTQAVVKEQSIAVFTNEGLGLSVSKNDSIEKVIVGEGQSFSLDATVDNPTSLYAYRSALHPNAVNSPFVETSLQKFVEQNKKTPTAPADNIVSLQSQLDILTPDENEQINTSTVVVSGLVNTDVNSVLINGYSADIQPDTMSFSLEISLPDKDEVAIAIQALDSEGKILAQERRTIVRNRKPPAAPAFISPAKNGDTYQTQSSRLEIIGEAPVDAVGIVVNDYRLQFFTPGEAKWKYLATTELGNLKTGTNVFNAYSINAAGIQSDVVTMTILVGGDKEGVIASKNLDEQNPEGEKVEKSIEPENLPKNAPLQPGSLSISSPSSALEFTTNSLEEILEGNAPKGTETVWVNDYRLKLFSPEKRLWNYIASFDLGTLKRGRNVYTITARDKDYQIIDSITFVLTYEPK